MATEEGLGVEGNLDVRGVWDGLSHQQQTGGVVSSGTGQVRRLVVGCDEAASTTDHLEWQNKISRDFKFTFKYLNMFLKTFIKLGIE